jgi:UDP-N-acetylglucosamine:LPS N-acetylglucosamine transferase
MYSASVLHTSANGDSLTAEFNSPDSRNSNGRLRVLAIASGGGHWVQLLRMRPAWDGCDVAYATSHADYQRDVRPTGSKTFARFYTFPDANINQKLRLVRQLAAVASIMLRERPDVVISTGASAGYFALRIAKYLRRRTIWVDSIANVEKMSLAGKNVKRFADLWLTQWPDLARTSAPNIPMPRHFGAVL